jgi:hypothetical protein
MLLNESCHWGLAEEVHLGEVSRPAKLLETVDEFLGLAFTDKRHRVCLHVRRHAVHFR